jgi:hypothetical protein
VVSGPNESRGCALSDISETGARIDIEEPEQVPDRFMLWLSANGSARRTCRVVWREGHQLGVIFDPRQVDTGRAPLAPRIAADNNAQAAPADAGDTTPTE